MENEYLIKWFKLTRVKGLGPMKILKLLDIYKNIQNIWESSTDELLKTRIFKEKMIENWSQLKNTSDEKYEKIINECKQNNIKILPLFSEAFPKKLKFIPNPPLNLFLQGNKDLLNYKIVAIVGSRRSDETSKRWSFEQSLKLAKNDVVVVSGGALGIDIEGHKGALEASGKTICVMGPGLLKLYPEQNIPIFERIKKTGLMISENLPSFPGSDIALLQRNRITSGLSDALIVATGDTKGGVMTQLRHAHEQKIPLFCPMQNYGFFPSDGVKKRKVEYRITEIENIEPVLKTIKNNNFPHLTKKQSSLF